jgi:hypothetical protein
MNFFLFPPTFEGGKKRGRKNSIFSINTRRAIAGAMRRLCAIVPPFGVEEDVRWVEEDVPEEDEAGIPRGKSDTKIADVDDDVGGGAAAAAASTSSTSSTTSSTSSTLDPEVLVPGVRRCLPPAPPPGSKPSILAILK